MAGFEVGAEGVVGELRSIHNLTWLKASEVNPNVILKLRFFDCNLDMYDAIDSDNLSNPSLALQCSVECLPNTDSEVPAGRL